MASQKSKNKKAVTWNKLSDRLYELYGEDGYAIADEDRFWRFSVSIGKGFLVNVHMTPKEYENRSTHLFKGETYDKYISRIPKEFRGFSVRVEAVETVVGYSL